MHRKSRAAVAALILTLTLAPAAMAATSADVTDSQSVTSTLALTLDKSTITYGSIEPGQSSQASAADRRVTASVVGGNVPSWTLTVTGSDFTRTGGGTIPASSRQGKDVTGSGPWADLPLVIPGTGSEARVVEFGVLVPTSAPAGDYAGTITFTVSGS
jgi:hypothetical protein